jgi:hypothetical protein
MFHFITLYPELTGFFIKSIMEINRDQFGFPILKEQEKGILFLMQSRLIFKPGLLYCLWRGIRNAAELVEHLNPENQEANLKECDEETRTNLLRLHRKFLHYPFNERPAKGTIWEVKVADELPADQQKILKDKVNSWLLELSGWTLKGLGKVMESFPNITLIECIIDTSIDYNTISEVGDKSVYELQELQRKTIKLVQELSSGK